MTSVGAWHLRTHTLLVFLLVNVGECEQVRLLSTSEEIFGQLTRDGV